jgi:ABC-type oligopeptide transport system ATPase subunit
MSLIEINSLGPGANTAKRVDHILSDAQAQEFTIAKILGARPAWIDFDYQK